jgi:hypothetical protein
MKRTEYSWGYRRDDSPGYVSRLEDELEHVFGKGQVFRMQQTAGGAKWRNVDDANLQFCGTDALNYRSLAGKI